MCVCVDACVSVKVEHPVVLAFRHGREDCDLRYLHVQAVCWIVLKATAQYRVCEKYPTSSAQLGAQNKHMPIET